MVTDFKIGEIYNLTWRMQYPHQGGYRIQLFDSFDRLIEQLSPILNTTNDSFDGIEDQTYVFNIFIFIFSSEAHIVKFNKECKNCTLRLERQALEWGKSYKFRSCAEVNILSKVFLKQILEFKTACQKEKNMT